MNTAQLLEQHNIKPLKSRDQFFLQDEEILDLEVALAKLHKDDMVLEIGAGTGNLTRKIARHAKVIAIENDKRFLPLLHGIENCSVIIGDALAVLAKRGLQFSKIISNIPYSKSQGILIELLQHRWQTAVLCVQREFAEKSQSKGKLGIAVNDCCKLTYAADVPASVFYPAAVDSSIIVLKQRKMLDFEFWKFLDVVYRKKNRDVKNVVKVASGELARKKVHQLDIGELKILFEAYKTHKKAHL